MFRILLFLALIAAPAAAQDRAAAERQFQDWLAAEIRPRALAEGVSPDTYDAALGEVRLNWKVPGIVPPGTTPDAPRAQGQSEFRSPGRYFRPNIIAGVAQGGQRLKGRYAETLTQLEERFGVPGSILLAIWGRETGFGNVAIPHDAFEVLGTMAFMGSHSPDWFKGELIALLKIAEAGHAPPGAIKSSWAGALGQPQFMPSSFLAYAADGDGDGRADIWRSEADTLASIASYLAQNGWVAGRDWGFEVTVPESVSCALEGPDLARPIDAWTALGVTRISGRPFPEAERAQEAFLLMPAGRLGPTFLVTPNFSALKAYNRSDLYALFIGNAADRIQWNMGAFQVGWQPVDDLLRSDVAAMQRALEAKGHDVGGADGLAGFKTRRSIGRWQTETGRAETCFPTAAVKAALTP